MRASAATGAQAQDMATPSKWQRQYYKESVCSFTSKENDNKHACINMHALFVVYVVLFDCPRATKPYFNRLFIFSLLLPKLLQLGRTRASLDTLDRLKKRKPEITLTYFFCQGRSNRGDAVTRTQAMYE